MEQAKIGLLRWESGQVPTSLMQLESLPGNSTNPVSYPFPVEMVHVKGANQETVAINPSEKVMNDMIDVTRDMYARGIRAVTTSCGFNAIFQVDMADESPAAIFTSSLMQVPFAQAIVGKNRIVAIITASKTKLSEEHLRKSGITDLSNVVVFGLENATEFKKIFGDEPCQLEKVTDEVLDVALQALREYPNIGAFVLECTDLPPFSSRIREETGLPVFDFNSMVGHVAMALNVHKLY